MDIDSSASTPILRVSPDLSNAQYLRYELTALAYYLKDRSGPEAGSPGPDGRRVHGARDRSRRGTRSHLRAGLRGGPGRRRRDQPDHRARRHGRSVSRLLRRDLHAPSRPHCGGRWAELRQPDVEPIRHHPGVARRYVGRHRRRRVHPHREHAVHGRSVQRLPRPSQGRRGRDDHALGVRRIAARVTGTGGVRGARVGRPVTPRDRAARSCGHVLAEEIAVHGGRDRAAACGERSARISRAVRCRECPRRRDAPRRGGRRRRLRPSDHRSRPRALLRRVRAGRAPDHRRSAILLSHHQACRPVPGRVWAVDALRQWTERTAHADGHRRYACRALRRRSARARRRPASSVVACVPRVLRRAGRRVHAHRGRYPAAVRAPPRASGVLVDRHVVFTAAWHRDWRGLESAAGWSRAGSSKRDHARQ